MDDIQEQPMSDGAAARRANVNVQLIKEKKSLITMVLRLFFKIKISL